MRKIFFASTKFIRFVLSSLAPLLLFIGVLIIFGAALVIYDRVQTYKDQRLGAELIKNLKVESACSQTVNAGEKFNLSFTFSNLNSVSAKLDSLRIEKSLLGTAGKKFVGLLTTNPSSSATAGNNSQIIEYNFKDAEVGGGGKLPITLTFQADSRDKAAANPHTFVIYTGDIFFDFKPAMTIETPCEIQVRYAE